MAVKILIVDDSKVDVVMIQNILSDYQQVVAYDGAEALSVLEREPDIDIMLLDLNMPVMDGFAVLDAIKMIPRFQKITTLILTNYGEIDNEIRGLELGAVDYIRKPLNLASLRKRIEIHVKLREATKELEDSNAKLEQTVARRTEELVLTRDITINALIGLLEVRDIESSNHTKRTQLIVKALCEHLRTTGKYRKVLTDRYVKELFDTAPLHDIGKVGIADSILLKPGKLTGEEFAVMKKHVEYGENALQHEAREGQSPSFIVTAMECICGHHEKYDGTGYPRGLKGEEIPLPGRLMAIVDVYDALISERVYKRAWSHAEAVALIREERGKHFDPDVVDAFLAKEDTIRAIAEEYSHQ